jgi:hypothetical protein
MYSGGYCQTAGVEEVTPVGGDGDNLRDLEIECRSVVADKSLSTYTPNVNIVVTNGNVTLKGPVRTKDGKTDIAAKATAVISIDRITNQTEIAPE